ncbi:MAG: hypothetical protein SOY30_16125 [Eubacteriales bacterium]|nr:hypothetical protein [Eubacteriales bacterium]
MRKITGVLVNVSDGTARKATIPNCLEGYYSALDCDLVDIVQRRLGGYRFDVICDDEALLKANPIPSAFDPYDRPMLFGSLFFCHSDKDGNMTSLNDREIVFILSRCYDTCFRGKLDFHWRSVRRLDY